VKEIGFREMVISKHENQRYLLIAYDISKTRIRNKVSKILKEYGFRIQRSVFEGIVANQQIHELLHKLEGILELTDNLKIYCFAVYSKTWEYGQNKFNENSDINHKIIVC